jgi:hypothetical protein
MSKRSKGRVSIVVSAITVVVGVALVVMVNRGGGLTSPVTAAEQAGTPGSNTKFLRWQIPKGSERYGAIDGAHLWTYVDEITTLTRNAREPGAQYWGRITGMPSDDKMRAWVETKFRQVGMQDVRTEPFDVVEPQWIPASWQLDVSAGGKTVKLESAHPFTKTAGMSGKQQLQAVWLGLGTQADFTGRDVKGKAAFIYSQPFPSWHNSTVTEYKAIQRAAEAGAALVVVSWGVPGNFEVQAGSSGGVKIPVFSIGKEDGEHVREMIEAQPKVVVDASLDVKYVPGLKSGTVWGVLPGATDEEILLMAHRDGFFEGAGDNASGMATILGIAEHFAKIPQAQRRRTLRFMAATGHHMTGPTDVAKLHTNRETGLAKTVLILNPEHVGWIETYMYGGSTIARANAITPLRWSSTGSDRLNSILFDAINEFGMIALQDEIAAWGDSSPVRNDAPTISLIQSPFFWHCACDTADTVPATGLEVAGRTVARIIDQVNALDRNDLLKKTTEQTTSARPRQP